MILIFLALFLTSCIPTRVYTDNPRSGVWTMPSGHAWRWHVDQPDIVGAACGWGAAGCVKWTPFEKTGEIWMVDAATMAAHECKHAVGFAKATNMAHVEAELSHSGESRMPWHLTTGGPAKDNPCQ